MFYIFCNYVVRYTYLATDNEIITDVPESEDQDEQIPKINEFLFWQTPDDLDDDDDDPEEQEENSQKEFPNSRIHKL
jgi:hypothetical protein